MRTSGNYRVGIEADAPKGPKVLGTTTGTVGTAILEYPEEWRRVTDDAAARAFWWGGSTTGHVDARRRSAVAFHGNSSNAGRGADCRSLCHPSLFLPMLYSLIAKSRTRRGDVAGAFADVRSVLVGSTTDSLRATKAHALRRRSSRAGRKDIEGRDPTAQGPTGNLLESILRATIMQSLGVELEVVRTADPPSRFKGVTVVEEGDLERRG